MVEQLQQQLLAKDAEIQRQSAELQQKMKEMQLKEAEIQRLAKQHSGKNCTVHVYIDHLVVGHALCVACGELYSKHEYHFGGWPRVCTVNMRHCTIHIKWCVPCYVQGM